MYNVCCMLLLFCFHLKKWVSVRFKAKEPFSTGFRRQKHFWIEISFFCVFSLCFLVWPSIQYLVKFNWCFNISFLFLFCFVTAWKRIFSALFFFSLGKKHFQYFFFFRKTSEIMSLTVWFVYCVPNSICTFNDAIETDIFFFTKKNCSVSMMPGALSHFEC